MLPPNEGNGIQRPTAGTPPRRRNSVRRTSTIDLTRPDGYTGRIHMYGAARELHTGDPDASPTVLDTSQFTAEIAFPEGRDILMLTTDPGVDEFVALLGAPAMSGFRRILAKTLPAHLEGSLLQQLLDDIPVTTMISSYMQTRHETAVGRPKGDPLAPLGVCAGWREGGTLVSSLRQGRRPRVIGPVAPSLRPPDDSYAWHVVDPARADLLRRHRRLDAVLADDGHLHVQTYLRDSYWFADGADPVETIIHEYTVDTVVDTADFRVLDAAIEPHVLPWKECLSASAGPGTLVGRRTVAEDVHRPLELARVTPCTHLNDILRTLRCAQQLAGRLSA